MKPYALPAAITIGTLLTLAFSRSSEAKPPPPIVPIPDAFSKANDAKQILDRAQADPRGAVQNLDPDLLRLQARQMIDAGYPDLAAGLRDLATSIEKARVPLQPPPATAQPPPPATAQPPPPVGSYATGVLAPDLAASIRNLLDRGIQQTSLDAIDAAVRELAKYRGFDPEKIALAKRRLELRTGGLSSGVPGAGAVGVLPADLAERITRLLDRGIPQASLAPIDAAIRDLARYQGFETQKTALATRKLELKNSGL